MEQQKDARFHEPGQPVFEFHSDETGCLEIETFRTSDFQSKIEPSLSPINPDSEHIFLYDKIICIWRLCWISDLWTLSKGSTPNSRMDLA